MKITIKPEVFRKLHPKLKVVFIVAKNIDNKTRIKEANHLLKEVEKMILMTFNKNTVKTHHLVAPWTVARQQFGKKATHYHTSVERLLKKVLQHQKVEAKDTVTAVVRYLSLKHIIPVGVDDQKKVQGDITFDTKKGDIFYHDAKKVLGTKLDYWKNAKTALRQSSDSTLIHLEFLPPVSPAKQKEIVKETTELVRMFCGGQVKMVELDKKNNSATI